MYIHGIGPEPVRRGWSGRGCFCLVFPVWACCPPPPTPGTKGAVITSNQHPGGGVKEMFLAMGKVI